jgi:hypothetical protein
MPIPPWTMGNSERPRSLHSGNRDSMAIRRGYRAARRATTRRAFKFAAIVIRIKVASP